MTYFGQEYNCHCLEWVVYSDSPYLINLAVQKFMEIKSMIIVGDSTGVNLAYQFRQMRNLIEGKIVLLSPLFVMSTMKINLSFSEIFC